MPQISQATPKSGRETGNHNSQLGAQGKRSGISTDPSSRAAEMIDTGTMNMTSKVTIAPK